MMVKTIKSAFNESGLRRLMHAFTNAYVYSRLKSFVSASKNCFEDSAIGRAQKKFALKRTKHQYSVYQRALDKISVLMSGFTVWLHGFFAQLLSGSAFFGVFSSFIDNSFENKLRAIGLFSFYFFWAAAGFALFGAAGRGRAALLLAVSFGFLFLSVFARKLAEAFKTSFFINLLKGLFE